MDNQTIKISEEEIVTLEETDNEIILFEDSDDEKIVPISEDQGGTSNYENLSNKPKINGIELSGNKESSDLKLQEKMEELSNLEIEELLGGK